MSATILLAEDESPLRQVLARTLRAAGYDVREARHGGEALQLYDGSEGGVDLLITDAVMPVVDGAALIQALRARQPGLKTLCISGNRTSADYADAFMAKPFSGSALLGVVRLLLHQGE